MLWVGRQWDSHFHCVGGSQLIQLFMCTASLQASFVISFMREISVLMNFCYRPLISWRTIASPLSRNHRRVRNQLLRSFWSKLLRTPLGLRYLTIWPKQLQEKPLTKYVCVLNFSFRKAAADYLLSYAPVHRFARFLSAGVASGIQTAAEIMKLLHFWVGMGFTESNENISLAKKEFIGNAQSTSVHIYTYVCVRMYITQKEKSSIKVKNSLSMRSMHVSGYSNKYPGSKLS